MVKKEQIQKELEMQKQGNKDLQKLIGELNAEIAELKKELEEAKKAADEAKTAAANSDGSPSAKATEDKPDGRAETGAAARDPESEGTDELKGKIGILLGAIAASCKDHCPHHLNAQACPNCNIYKAVFNAGFQMPEEIKNEE